MRLMLAIFSIVFLVIVDQTQFGGRFGMQAALLLLSGLAQIGL